MTPEKRLMQNADRACTEFLLADGMLPENLPASTVEKMEEVNRRVRALASGVRGAGGGGGETPTTNH